jgi:hypothetical protein
VIGAVKEAVPMASPAVGKAVTTRGEEARFGRIASSVLLLVLTKWAFLSTRLRVTHESLWCVGDDARARNKSHKEAQCSIKLSSAALFLNRRQVTNGLCGPCRRSGTRHPGIMATWATICSYQSSSTGSSTESALIGPAASLVTKGAFYMSSRGSVMSQSQSEDFH